MSAQDMRDMLGLTGEAPRPTKKRKTVEKRPVEKGMAREVTALMGERAPPVSMIQVQTKYKQRPKRHVKAAPWKWTAFANEARTDDLRLHHWQRERAVKQEPTSGTTGEDAQPEENAQKPEQKPYQFSRFNIENETPAYDEALYEASLTDEQWTKEETDYLIELVKDYGQKWPIVWDRYEYTSTKQEDEEAPAVPATRSLEDLKARFYTIKAKVLAHEIPVASMNGQQYSLYQTLINFDPKQETGRKKMTETHLYRSDFEVQEETALLAELQRIMINQTQLEAARRDIRDRLDYPPSASSIQYTTSQALAQLFQQLMAADRTKKDRRLKDLPAPAAPSHRDSITANPKRPRDSLASLPDAAAVGSSSASGARRALSPHSRDRFFVTLHDRLSAGVTFASDKLTKPRVAKSTVQTERIAAILHSLKVPDAIPLPTQRVVDDFDRLMAKVAALLELRKVAEREDAELKARGAEGALKKEGTGSVGPDARGVKRSASVLSESGERGEKRRK